MDRTGRTAGAQGASDGRESVLDAPRGQVIQMHLLGHQVDHPPLPPPLGQPEPRQCDRAPHEVPAVDGRTCKAPCGGLSGRQEQHSSAHVPPHPQTNHGPRKLYQSMLLAITGQRSETAPTPASGAHVLTEARGCVPYGDPGQSQPLCRQTSVLYLRTSDRLWRQTSA